MAFSIISTFAGAVKGLHSGMKKKRTADEMESLARREAELNWKATQAEVANLKKTHESILSQADANVSAMGFKSDRTTSQGQHLAEVKKDFDAERQLMLEMGESAHNIAQKNADLIGRQGSGAVGKSVFQGATQGFSMGGGSSSWWAS